MVTNGFACFRFDFKCITKQSLLTNFIGNFLGKNEKKSV